MDTGLGNFAPVSKDVEQMFETIPNLLKSRVFKEGEEVQLKGSRFKIVKIKKTTLRLLLLPDKPDLT